MHKIREIYQIYLLGFAEHFLKYRYATLKLHGKWCGNHSNENCLDY